MPFVAECTFCQQTLQGVPESRLGCSVQCPRCRNYFTLAPMSKPVTAAKAGPRVVRARAPASSAAAVAVPSAATPTSTASHESWTQEPRSQLPESVRPTVPAPKKPFPVVQVVGLGSFMLGSAAFLMAALAHVALITLVLGLVGMLLGIVGSVASRHIAMRPLLSAAGGVVSLAAVIFTVFLPHLLGLNPLWGVAPPTTRAETASISLSGEGGFRDTAKGDSPWIDASQNAVHHGDVRVRILSAVVGRVDFEPIQGKITPEVRGLVVRLRITNAGITRKVPYTSWGDAHASDMPVLRDEHGRGYRIKTFRPEWIVKGRAINSTIPSGKSLEDVLIFETPPNSIAYLRLELPAAAAGAQGQLRIEIPRKMIFFR